MSAEYAGGERMQLQFSQNDLPYQLQAELPPVC